MGPVILDTNIWIRASALEPAERDDRNHSRHDELSNPTHGGGHVRPSECRFLIAAYLKKPGGLFVPSQQRAEFHSSVEKLRSERQMNQRNLDLIEAVASFVNAAAEGNRVPVTTKDLEEQRAVISAALSIATSTANSRGGLDRARAQRFLEKNSLHLARTLPQPNIEMLQNARRPYIVTDWLLARAARKVQGVVVSADRDMVFINQAYLQVTGYAPCRLVEHTPASLSPEAFRRELQAPNLSQNPVHFPRLRLSHVQEPTPSAQAPAR